MHSYDALVLVREIRCIVSYNDSINKILIKKVILIHSRILKTLATQGFVVRILSKTYVPSQLTLKVEKSLIPFFVCVNRVKKIPFVLFSWSISFENQMFWTTRGNQLIIDSWPFVRIFRNEDFHNVMWCVYHNFLLLSSCEAEYITNTFVILQIIKLDILLNKLKCEVNKSYL